MRVLKMLKILQKRESLEFEIACHLCNVHLERNHTGNDLHQSLYFTSVRDIHSALRSQLVVDGVVYDIFHSRRVGHPVLKIERIIAFLKIAGKMFKGTAALSSHIKAKLAGIVQKFRKSYRGQVNCKYKVFFTKNKND